MGHRLQHVRARLFTPGALGPHSSVNWFCKGENVTKLNPGRKFRCLLVILSCMSVGYAQDAAHKILKKVPVQYPQALKEKGIQGDVRLKVFIKPDGSVKNTELLGGNPILAESAQKSVSKWKFSSGNSETTVEIVVHFDPAAMPEN
jgi:TonB family protein